MENRASGHQQKNKIKMVTSVQSASFKLKRTMPQKSLFHERKKPARIPTNSTDYVVTGPPKIDLGGLLPVLNMKAAFTRLPDGLVTRPSHTKMTHGRYPYLLPWQDCCTTKLFDLTAGFTGDTMCAPTSLGTSHRLAR